MIVTKKPRENISGTEHEVEDVINREGQCASQLGLQDNLTGESPLGNSVGYVGVIVLTVVGLDCFVLGADGLRVSGVGDGHLGSSLVHDPRITHNGSEVKGSDPPVTFRNVAGQGGSGRSGCFVFRNRVNSYHWAMPF